MDKFSDTGCRVGGGLLEWCWWESRLVYGLMDGIVPICD